MTLGGDSGSMESPATTSFWSALCTSRRAAGCPSYSSIVDYTKLTPEFHITGNQRSLPAVFNKINEFCTFKSIYVDLMWASMPLYHYCICARSWSSFINPFATGSPQTTTHGYAIYPCASALRAPSFPSFAPYAASRTPILASCYLFNRFGIRYILARLSSLLVQ